MDDKITIIEGPPPTFEAVNDEWALGLNESPHLAEIAVTHLRAFNGAALVERCHRAWRHQGTINLVFRTSEGLERQAPIVAARNVELDEGHLLILWVRLADDDFMMELDYNDNLGDENEDNPDLPDAP